MNLDVFVFGLCLPVKFIVKNLQLCAVEWQMSFILGVLIIFCLGQRNHCLALGPEAGFLEFSRKAVFLKTKFY